MTRADAAALLAALAAAYRVELSDDTAEAWYQSTFERAEIAEERTVLAEVIAGEERMPTPAVWSRYRRDLARRRQQPRAPAPPTDVDDTPQARDQRVSVVRALRAALTERALDHDHHEGPDHCPACSARSDLAARVEAAAALLASLPAGPRVTYACRCAGARHLPTKDGAVYPCPDCNATMYERWLATTRAPRHGGRW